MDDEISLPEIEKAVNHFAQPPAGQAAELAAMEELAARDENYPLMGQAASLSGTPISIVGLDKLAAHPTKFETFPQRSDREVQPAARRQVSCQQNLLEPFDFGLRL